MTKIPLKTFWEAVNERLAAFSLEELRSILLAMAEETSPTQRRPFLDKLKPMSKEIAASVQKTLGQEKLLADIDDLEREIKTKMKNADYWDEERYAWSNDDEDSLGPYEEFVEPLTALFDRTEAAFDYGNLKLARAAYQKLFDVLAFEDDYGRGLRADDLGNVDAGETRARYLRAVYETESTARRPKVLFDRMLQTRLGYYKPNATLDDIIQISRKPLPDHARFFEDWIAFLQAQSGNDADAWLREAVRLSRGTLGLEELARKEGKKRPRAYLDWFIALEGEGKPRDVLVAAQDALRTLPAKLYIRADVADHLCIAAAKLNDTESLGAARWEAFAAVPTLARLLDLWDAAPEAEQTRLMQQAAAYAKNYIAHPPRQRETIDGDWNSADLGSPAWMSKCVLGHAYLLAKEWNAAYELAAREKVLGWSSTESSQGLVVVFFLTMLSGKRSGKLPSNLGELWQAVLGYSSGFGHWNSADEKSENRTLERLKQTYARGLEEASLNRSEQDRYLAWCLGVAKQRVDAIVSELHRGSYDKAARLIAACAETLQLRGDVKGAAALLEDTRNRFPRHRAFQAELNTVIPQAKRGRR